MRDSDGDYVYNGGHVAMWHPWSDRPGVRHTPSFVGRGGDANGVPIYGTLDSTPWLHASSLERLVAEVAGRGLLALCGDVLNESILPYGNALVGAPGVTTYLSRQGFIAAMRVAQGRKSGYLVPCATWKWLKEPCRELVMGLIDVFTRFGFESTTPASLSEKVLRATLPTPLQISRPSAWLRRDILNNHSGGRIDPAKPAFYWQVSEFDKVKAYPSLARWVPSPFCTPVIRTRPGLDEVLNEYACGWWQCTLVAVACHPHPIQVEGGRDPVHGEVIERWLWTNELLDCLESGYQVVSIARGYGWREMSNFMVAWAELLYLHYEQCADPWIRTVIKTMMVGLPGRFLRQPEIYRLVTRKEAREGDIPLMMHWTQSSDQKFSDWMIRTEYDPESTALAPVGSYIVAEMRHELFQRMKMEVRHGYLVVRSYIDCYAIAKRSDCAYVANDQTDDRRCHHVASTNVSGYDGLPETYRNIGTGMGQWKEKRYTDVWAIGNRFIGVRSDSGEREMKAPGLEGASTGRIALWHEYYRKVIQYA